VSRLFVDTSALIAHLDGADPRRPSVDTVLTDHADDEFVTHGYVVAEALAVARRRLGVEAAVALIDDVLPGITILPVDPATYASALAAYRTSLPSATSFVDQVSLEVVAREAITAVFALDADLARPGITLLPAP